MSRLGCRDVGFLQNVSSYFISLSPGLSFGRILQLSEILIALEYMDKNFLWLITDVVCSVPQLIPSNELMLLLKILKLCKTCNVLDINPHLFKTITNMVISDPSNVITAFTANVVFSKLNHSNVYLNQLCNELSKVIPEYSVKERIAILDECIKHGIEVVTLYKTILESLEPLLDEGISDEDHFRLISMFAALKFPKGVYSCLLSIKRNNRNVQGLMSLKYREVLDSIFNSREHLSDALKVEDGGILSDEEVPGDDVTKMEDKGRRNPLGIERMRTAKEVLEAYDHLLEMSSRASQVEVALAICHADSTEYKRRLVKQLGRDIPAEVVPAILKSLILSLEADDETKSDASVQRDPIYRTAVKLFDSLFSGGLEELSNKSFSALIALFDCGILKDGEVLKGKYDRMLKRKEWIDDVTKELETRIDGLDRYKDVLDGRLLIKSAIVLLKVGGFDTHALSRCLCKNADFINPKQIPVVLDLFVKFGFNDKDSLRMLEPCIDKSGDLDIQGALKVEKLCNRLGISTKPPLEEPLHPSLDNSHSISNGQSSF